ncbi:MAG: hypothetical protein JF622_16355, partial [Terrabacter sp.]|nr:hypothetical protein [Terrabacter sp.]
MDTWHPGQVSLLRRADFKYNLTSNLTVVKGYQDKSGNDAAFLLEGNVLYKLLDASRVSITTGSGGTALAFTNFGDLWFLVATDGIFSGTNTTTGVKIWDAPAGTPTKGMISAVKQRIVAAWDNKLYILPMVNAGATTLPTTWTGGLGLVMTHPDAGWYWTDCTQGPSAIYASGCNTTHSDIYKFVSDLSSSTEVFIPIITASMPRGECISSIFCYVGSFVGIATTRGFRVGELDSGGDISYGPLLFEPTGGCQSITGLDRFMYVGSSNAHDGNAGLFRVDLGTAYQEASTNVLRYAYARDVYAVNTPGIVQSVSTFGATDRLIFTVKNNSVWTQSAQDLYADGYIQTARVRFNTEEPKLYKFLSISAPNPLLGNLGITIIDVEGNEWPSLTYGPTLNPGTSDVTISQPSGGQKWIKLKFTLHRGTDTTTGAILDGWQIKALPGSIRQRMISHTFLVFDEEKDKTGQR